MPLKKFFSKAGLPANEAEIIAALHSPQVKEVRNFVLGSGLISNIPQACQMWLERTGLKRKATLIPGRIPDEYLAAAMAVTEPKVVPLYWTCAVFGREKDLFFGPGINTLMFFVSQVMPLDSMQLAAAPDKLTPGIVDDIREQLKLPSDWRQIASHKSPAPLLDDLLKANPHVQWVEATSNGAAAVMCGEGTVDAGIITETARVANNLRQIHNYGCPDMVFFGGLTEHGANVLCQVNINAELQARKVASEK